MKTFISVWIAMLSIVQVPTGLAGTVRYSIVLDKAMTEVAGSDDWYRLGGFPEGLPHDAVVYFQDGDRVTEVEPYIVNGAGEMAFTVTDNRVIAIDGIEIPDSKPQTVRIYFDRPSTWSKTPHIHIYHAVTGAADVTDVNDTPMLPLSGNRFYYDLNPEAIPQGYNIIFNNGGWGDGQYEIYVSEPRSAVYAVIGGVLVEAESMSDTDEAEAHVAVDRLSVSGNRLVGVASGIVHIVSMNGAVVESFSTEGPFRSQPLQSGIYLAVTPVTKLKFIIK